MGVYVFVCCVDESTDRGKSGSERLSDVSGATLRVSRPAGKFGLVAGTVPPTRNGGTRTHPALPRGRVNTAGLGASPSASNGSSKCPPALPAVWWREGWYSQGLLQW